MQGPVCNLMSRCNCSQRHPSSHQRTTALPLEAGGWRQPRMNKIASCLERTPNSRRPPPPPLVSGGAFSKRQSFLRLSRSGRSGMASDSANPHRGAHDGAIASLLDKHESRVDLLLDSMLTYLKKTQPSYFEGEEESLASRTIADVLKRVSSDAASESTASEENRLAASLAISEMTTPKELKVTVSPSAQQALERAAAKKAEQIASPGASETDIPLGTKCSHNGCEVCYAGPSTYEASACVYHTGTPVFHEGLKFWSCCNKVKVTDFGDFLNIKGCCTGRHEFSTKDETMAQKRECRTDFFQQGTTVSFNIYAKLGDPTKCSFTLRRRPSDGGGEPEYVLSFHVHFEGEYDFKRTIVLAGPVDIDTCLVDILQPKIEIKLKKADGRGWNSIGEVVEEDDLEMD